jgi:TetR/AcrR family transcriptional regulator, transcriptional repressor for nem operon
MAGSDAKAKIVQAAFQLFHEAGYNGTSIQDIVNAAGLPKGTFYNHFKSKELLALEILKQYSGLIHSTLSADSHVSPLKRLRDHFECLAGAYRSAKFEKGCMIGNLTAEMAATSVIRKALLTHTRRWSEDIATLLEEAVRWKELPKTTDAEQLSKYLLDFFQGATLRSKLERSGEPIDTFLSVVFSSILVKR